MAGTGGSPENWKPIPNYGTGTEVTSSHQNMIAECIDIRYSLKALKHGIMGTGIPAGGLLRYRK